MMQCARTCRQVPVVSVYLEVQLHERHVGEVGGSQLVVADCAAVLCYQMIELQRASADWGGDADTPGSGATWP